ncbi:MAG: hypothetical protein KDK90_29000, partial [Leptospiraceae bacterium]|nr:hypothetical protein [Leptospiraceae bacterium]
MKIILHNIIFGILLLFTNCNSPLNPYATPYGKSSCKEAILNSFAIITNLDKVDNSEYTMIFLLIAVKSACDPNFDAPAAPNSGSSAKITNKANSTFFCASYLNPPSEEATSILCNQF